MSKASGSIDLKSLKVAGDGASKYITAIDGDGIKVHSAGNLQRGVQITDEIDIIRNGESVATFGEATKIGHEGSSSINITNSSVIGAGPYGIEYFNFNNDGPSGEVSGYEYLYSYSPASSIPYMSGTGKSVTVNGTPSSLSIQFYGFTNFASNDFSETIAFTPGTAETKTVSATVSNITYTLTATYDGSATMSDVRFTEKRNSKNLYIIVRVKYQAIGSTPTFSIGSNNISEGKYSLSIGYRAKATGDYSFAGGYGTGPQLMYEHYSEATGNTAFAFGRNTSAQGNYSMAIGMGSSALSPSSVAVGQGNTSRGDYSFSTGAYNEAVGRSQTVIGEYNYPDSRVPGQSTNERTEHAFIIGNGAVSSLSNALTVDWDGNIVTSGNITTLNHSSAIGTVVSKVGATDYTTNISSGTETWKAIGYIEVTVGRYIVFARARFDPTNSGAHYSDINISLTSASNSNRDRRYGAGTYINQHSYSTWVNVTEDNVDENGLCKIYLNGYSNVAGNWVRTNVAAFYLAAMRIM